MDNNINKNICLYSYNSRGSREMKLDFINDVIKLCSGTNIPIFCIQEHFLLRSNLYKISKNLPSHSVVAKPAYKDFKTQDRRKPMGGLATIVPKFIRKKITLINCQSWRLQPFLINLNKKISLLIPISQLILKT